MRRISILFILTVFTLMYVQAQENEDVTEEGANQAEFNADQDQDREGELEAQPSEIEDGQPVEAAMQDSLGGGVSEPVNITPTGSRTTSSGGSPGVFMEEGNQPDGTNTMQRAKPNIAGSPVPGAKQDSNVDMKSEVPENKIFRGDTQEAVPARVEKEENLEKDPLQEEEKEE